RSANVISGGGVFRNSTAAHHQPSPKKGNWLLCAFQTNLSLSGLHVNNHCNPNTYRLQDTLESSRARKPEHGSSRTDNSSKEEASAGCSALVQYDCIHHFRCVRTTQCRSGSSHSAPKVPPERAAPRSAWLVMRKLYRPAQRPVPSAWPPKLFNFARPERHTVAVQDQVLSLAAHPDGPSRPDPNLGAVADVPQGSRVSTESWRAAAAAVAAAAELGRKRSRRNTRRMMRPAARRRRSASSQTSSAHSPAAATASASSAGYRALACFIEMLRNQLQHLVDERDLPTVLECPPSRGWDLNNETSKQLMGLLLLMLSGVLDGKHSCRNDSRRCGLPVLPRVRASGTSNAACVPEVHRSGQAQAAAREGPAEVTPQQPPTSQASGTSDDRRSSKTSQRPAETAVEPSVTVLTSASAPGGASGSGGAAASTRRKPRPTMKPSGSADDQQEPALLMLIWLCTCVWFGLLLKELESHTDMEALCEGCLKAENSALWLAVWCRCCFNCLALHSGAEVFWSILEREFTSDSWRTRFDAVEKAQLDLESRAVDITCATGNSNRDSEAFMRKYNRARFAVARTDSVRSVSSSAFVKPPYRRACAQCRCTCSAGQAKQPRPQGTKRKISIRNRSSQHQQQDRQEHLLMTLVDEAAAAAASSGWLRYSATTSRDEALFHGQPP
uniref:Protein kinase domain-containing protein n=1 Tax=Macrostomum lignano TaxID=282301 RepID=A0A1I8FA41_9PLAT